MIHRYLSPIENWLTGGVIFLLSYSAWARGGTIMPFQVLLPWIGLLLIVSLFIVSWVYRNDEDAPVYGLRLVVRLLKDPVFYFGFVFMVLLLLQWLNAGREHVFDEVARKWIYAPPKIAFLPSAIAKEEAAEMLRWFFPAWAVLLVMRSGLITRYGIKTILLGIVINAAILASFGLFQYGTGTNSMFWVIPLDCDFFASFGYANHAAAFFVLILSVALGFLANVCFRSYRKKKFNKRIIGFTIISILLLAAANLSLSVAGIVFSWMLVVFAVSYAVWYVWKDIRLTVRINLVVACVAVLCLGYFVAAGVGKESFSESVVQMQKKTTEKEVGVRYPQIKVAFNIWQDNKLCGVGGWGYRYFFPDYADDDTWRLLKSKGSANVHNDPVQFLTEFGLVGFLMMSGVVVCLIVPVWQKGLRIIRKPRVLYPVLGVCITIIHSFFDLPFRSPTILYHWLVILVAIPYLGDGKKRVTS